MKFLHEHNVMNLLYSQIVLDKKLYMTSIRTVNTFRELVTSNLLKSNKFKIQNHDYKGLMIKT